MKRTNDGVGDLSPEKRALLERALLAKRRKRAEESTIPVARSSGPCHLSSSQQRLWFLDRFLGGTAAYNIQRAIRLNGPLDIEALQCAVDGLVARHESLRTTFEVKDEAPRQIVHPAQALPIDLEDLGGVPESEREAVVQKRIRSETNAVFDLERGPLLRVKLMRLGEARHVLVLVIHHIISDGWSMGVLQRELSALYAAAVRGEETALPPLPIQYTDYTIWQREWLRGKALERQLDYWKEQLAGTPLLELPTDRTRPPVQSYKGAVHRFTLDAELVNRLKALGGSRRVTLYMVLLAAYQTLLSRYSGQSDIVVGSPIAGRNRTELEGLIGFFVNTLVLRTDLSGNPSFAELLTRVRSVALNAYGNQDLPFEKLVEELVPMRDLSRNPLVQVMFALQNAPSTDLVLEGVTVESLALRNDTSKFDLTLSLTEASGALRGEINYATDLFDAATIERLAGHFETLLKGVADDPERPLAELPLLTEAELRQVLLEWNATERPYPKDACIHELFEQQAARAPQAPALVDGDRTLSYGELNARANQLAHALRARGVGAEDPVGLCVERSLEMVIGILGILKAGGAYVPLDPSYPRERLEFMLADTGSPLVLAQETLLDVLPPCSGEILCVDRDADAIARESRSDPARVTTAGDLAYIIYTSGSTGRPKGVAVSHRAVNRLVCNTDYVHLDSSDCLAQISNTSFDAATFELWGALLNGARLVILPKRTMLSAEDLARQIRAHGVTTLFLTAAVFNQCARAATRVFSGVRNVLFGGEAADPGAVAAVLENDAPRRLVNAYGPTEVTTFATCHEVREPAADGQTIPIGRPIANTEAYILDAHLKPVPVGVAGELYLGGDGLARGYLNRPELTAERFVAHPFRDDALARLYRTGDRARYRADGGIEFLGRLDDQVKVRGYRIELGEIEAVLTRHTGVREAVVTVREDTPGDKRLVAYAVLETNGAIERDELRGYLKAKLPEYMVPVVVTLERLPLTPNGKVDRKALPAPNCRAGESSPPAGRPADPIVLRLVEIWEDVLGVGPIRPSDNYFDLGGHSLLAVTLLERIRKAFGTVLPLDTLWHEGGSVESLAAILRRDQERDAAVKESAIPVRAAPGPCDLSFAQQRLWFLDRFLGGTSAYNIARALRLRGALDLGALQCAVDGLIARHESLRTTFEVENGSPRQVIHAPPRLPLELEDLSGIPAVEREAALEARVRSEANTVLDLSRGPLFRVKLLRLGEDEHALVLVIHHIISDGWSMGVLQRELSALYAAAARGEAAALPALPIQYPDYAIWQREWLRGEVLERQLSYWKEQLAGVPLLEIPTDRARPEVQSYRGSSYRFALEGELVVRLKELSSGRRVTLYMLLLAAFQTLLSRYSGQEDIAVGSPIAGRNRGELEGLIGFFVNTLVLRTDLSGNPRFVDLLDRVREVALGAFGSQDLPFEKLVEELVPTRDLSRNPLVQVMFALQNAPATELEFEGLTGEPLKFTGETSKFDLTLSLTEKGDALRGEIGYATDLFDRATIERMAGHFETLLRGVAADPTRPVSELPLLTGVERRRLLREWNATATPYPRDACIHELFEQQAALTPQALAVTDGGRALTYRELNERANQLAHALRARGVGAEVLVGLCLERSLEMVIGILGILKAGGAYVPLDPSYPRERLEFMLADTRSPVVVTEQALLDSLPPAAAEVVCVDRDAGALARESLDNPARAAAAHNLAYVIYTSGSTGTPKGACVTHRAVNRLVRDTDYVRLDASDCVAQASNTSFDAATFELWGALLNGARLVILPKETVLSPSDLAREIRDHGITTLFLTTALFNQCVQTESGMFAGVENVLFGGEAVDVRAVAKILASAPPRRLLHVYGPTETTTFATWHEVEQPAADGRTIPIGRPIANTEAYVLDPHLNPVPAGIAGELYLGGDGVARGYLNRPELTAERFVAHPFSDDPRARLYRTGDRVRFRADGDIEFLGRFDDQVKVRGHRIELGEIEAVLTRHAAVREAVAIVREDTPGDKRLAAYVVLEEGGGATREELRSHVKSKLPEYMVPAVVTLDRLPLTPNGKVDRKALPAPAAGGARPSPRSKPAVADPLILHLTKIWEDVLGVSPIQPTDNFFDLGGHSLLAVPLFERIRKAFGKSLPLDTLWYSGGSIEHVAGILRQDQESVVWPTLVEIQPHGNRRPLFCVHTMGGNLFHYDELARGLDSEQPVFGLQARGVYGNDAPHSSVEDIASDCIEAMRAQQPEGPYLIAGFSSGGVVAFEMARQLRERGEKVGLLALLDTFAPGAPCRGRFRKRLWDLLRLRDLRHFQEVLYHFFLSNLRLSRLRDLKHIGEAHRWAHWSYRPKPYDGRVDLFLADRSAELANDPSLGWRRVTRGGLVIEPVSGSHGEMVKQPNVRLLAEKLQARMDAACREADRELEVIGACS